MAEFLVGLTLMASIRMEADDEDHARRLIDEHIHGSSANLGAWPNGDPIVTEVFLDDDGPDSIEEGDTNLTVIPPTSFDYSPWRHGGWYVNNVRYPSGAVGCVSRNYDDKKWRIVCDPRPFEDRPTFKSRDAAALAEWHLTQEKTDG